MCPFEKRHFLTWIDLNLVFGRNWDTNEDIWTQIAFYGYFFDSCFWKQAALWNKIVVICRNKRLFQVDQLNKSETETESELAHTIAPLLIWLEKDICYSKLHPLSIKGNSWKTI